MEDVFQVLLPLILGWLLGLLGPTIVERIKSKRDASETKVGIQNELDEVSSVLMAACYKVTSSSGALDRKFLKWHRDRLEPVRNRGRNDRFLTTTKALLAFDDDQLSAGTAKLRAPPEFAPMLQKYPVPLLDQRVSTLQALAPAFQSKVLEIRRNISILDSIVDQYREFYRMTFQQLAAGNIDIVRGNLVEMRGEYASRARTIVDAIDDLRRTT